MDNKTTFLTMEELPDVLDAKVIAQYMRVSTKQVYNWFDLIPAAGGIPCFRIGKSRRARKDEFLQWFELVSKQREEHRNGKINLRLLRREDRQGA